MQPLGVVEVNFESKLGAFHGYKNNDEIKWHKRYR